MNPLPNLLPLAEAFGLMVAHSLWQITLIWLVFKMVEWKLSTRHQAVYLSSLVAMLAAAAWASITFLREWSRLQPMEPRCGLPETMRLWSLLSWDSEAQQLT